MLLWIAVTASLIASSRIVTPAAPEPWQPVQELVTKIKQEPSIRERTEDAYRLVKSVKERAQQKIPDRLLSEITSLMGDRDDSVRYWTATALGYLGPQATAAIPALERALEEVKDVHAMKTSASAIRIALTRVRAVQESGE
jgi:hypothetical protein